MVNVQIDPLKGPAGGGVCMLPLDLAGIKRGSPLEKHGVRDLPQGDMLGNRVFHLFSKCLHHLIKGSKTPGIRCWRAHLFVIQPPYALG